jgi:hypothetical protein
MFRRLYARLMTLRADRGEGPVPFIIIVAIMSMAAAFIAWQVRDIAVGWLNSVERAP